MISLSIKTTIPSRCAGFFSEESQGTISGKRSVDIMCQDILLTGDIYLQGKCEYFL